MGDQGSRVKGQYIDPGQIKGQGSNVKDSCKKSEHLLEFNDLPAIAFELENPKSLDKLGVGSFALELRAISELDVARSGANTVAFKAMGVTSHGSRVSD